MELDMNIFPAGMPVVLMLACPAGMLVDRHTLKPMGPSWKAIIDMSAIANAMNVEAAAIPEAVLDDDLVRRGGSHEGVPAEASVKIARLSHVVAGMGYVPAGSIAAYTVRFVAGRCQISHQRLKTGRYIGGHSDSLPGDDFYSRKSGADRIRKVIGMMTEMFRMSRSRH